MKNLPNTDLLALLDAKFAVLSVGRYALPVRFRVRDSVVECVVPVWAGIGDSIEDAVEVTLVGAEEAGTDLRWLFLRGRASVVDNPEWGGLLTAGSACVGPDDLYQLVRIEPKRIELIDERRGWGVRETLDL